MKETIIRQAQRLGACEKASQVKSWESLIRLFFSPQGQEFCEKHQFPTAETWSQIKQSCEITRHGIFIDCDTVTIKGREKVAFIGRTNGRCRFSHPDKIHTVVLMHGATAQIKAVNYAVVKIVKIGECEVKTITDGTARILW